MLNICSSYLLKVIDFFDVVVSHKAVNCVGSRSRSCDNYFGSAFAPGIFKQQMHLNALACSRWKPMIYANQESLLQLSREWIIGRHSRLFATLLTINFASASGTVSRMLEEGANKLACGIQ